MSWLTKIACAHEFEKIADLKDDDANPKKVKVVRMCTKCGHFIEREFVAPGECIHLWLQHKETPLVDKWGTKTGEVSFIKKCGRCHDVKSTTV